jgi:hypothetical protein
MVLPDEYLEPAPSILKDDKGPLAEIPDGHDAPGDGEMLLDPLQGAGVQMAVFLLNVIRPVSDRYIVGVELHATCPERLDFFPFFSEKFAFFHTEDLTDSYKAI